MILVVLGLGAAGCDYIGAGASGVIALDPAVDAAGFRTLALRAFADPAATFDAAQAIPAGAADDQPLAALTFPYSYSVGGGVNDGSDTAGWMLVAWLSRRGPGEIERIESGDVFCAVPFRLRARRDAHWAGVTPDVDCTIATVAP